MRVSILLLVVASVCAGCTPGKSFLSQDATPPPAQPQGPAQLAKPDSPATAMTPDEITTLVDSTVARTVADEFVRRDQRRAAVQSDHAVREKELQEAARAAALAAEQQAEQAARTQAEQAAVEAARAARQENETVARFLLLPHESQRVDDLKQKLETEDIWRLSRQDLDFATSGLAAPLLRDALYAAAERVDPAIEMDVLAHKAALTPEEKIQMATMPPIERERLLTFTKQFDEGTPSVAADRFIRAYIDRYPFVRKILLAHLREVEPSN